jgi:hypothetical protein
MKRLDTSRIRLQTLPGSRRLCRTAVHGKNRLKAFDNNAFQAETAPMKKRIRLHNTPPLLAASLQLNTG